MDTMYAAFSNFWWAILLWVAFLGVVMATRKTSAK